MNRKIVLHLCGWVLIFFSAIPAIMALVSWKLEKNRIGLYAFGQDSLLCLALGILLSFFFRKSARSPGPKEGFAVVLLSWFFLCIAGALPFVFYHLPEKLAIGFIDALFESTSGFTTTGASILNDIEALPAGLLLWRSLTHWVGGMGIILLALAILPLFGAGGFQLYKAELPGPTKDRLTPRIRSTARILWTLYLGLTIAETLSLWFLGMSFFDAINHSFATIATGGFSPKNASVGAYGDWRIEAVITTFMFISGCNFLLLLESLKGNWRAFFMNAEFRLFAGIVFFSIIAIMALNQASSRAPHEGVLTSFRFVAFQVVSVISCTGFATEDYNNWANASQTIILFLMIIGACSGSTGGGIKIFRVLMMPKGIMRDIHQRLRPRAITHIHVDGKLISESLTTSVFVFVCLYFLTLGVFFLGIMMVEGDVFDQISILSACATCMAGVGPGLNDFGPTHNFAALSDLSKVALCALMVIGKLELFSAFAILHPDIWRR